MSQIYVPRRLIRGEDRIDEEALLQLRPVVLVLAEPGAGKSKLLENLSRRLGVQCRSAGLFRFKARSTEEQALVIDGLDEVARLDPDAVDSVIVKASDANVELVILASRASEWSEARTRFLIECFGAEPNLVYLEPFAEEEQRQLFEAAFPGEEFISFVNETRRFELSPLLGNPEFLLLFGEAFVQGGKQFTSKSKIFVDAVVRLAGERGDSPKQLGRAPVRTIIEVGEEIFAKLLLSGASGVSLSDDPADRHFPYLDSLTKRTHGLVKQVLDTRLFRPCGEPGAHEPVHRIVQEYCAAQYLDRRIRDPGDILTTRRVFALIAPNGTVRSELRGLIGWMAAIGDKSLQAKCVEIDPYAVLANGDPSQLSPSAKRLLLENLQAHSEIDPYFRRSDSWRSFSVAGFFDDVAIEIVRKELNSKEAHPELRGLYLDLLQGVEAVRVIVPELRTILLSSNRPSSERVRALRLLFSIPAHDVKADFAALINLGDRVSLRIAAEGGLDLDVQCIGREDIFSLLVASGKLAAESLRAEDQYSEHNYFVGALIKARPIDEVIWLLDEITRDLECTCGATRDYECDCLQSISRIVGKLLDRYFSLRSREHDPTQIWGWIAPLRFREQTTAAQSTAVAALRQDDELRCAIHRIAFADVRTEEQALNQRVAFSMSTSHSGLTMSDADLLALAEFAFQIDSVGLWAGLYKRHYRWNTGPDQRNRLRTAMRAHSRMKPGFLRAWSKCERDVLFLEAEERVTWPKRRKSIERRKSRAFERDRSYLRANREKISSGKDWNALLWIAHQYLLRPERLAEYLDDASDADQALCNSFAFLKPKVPSLASLVESKPQIVRVLHAAVLAHFRGVGGLHEIDNDILFVVKTDLGGYDGYHKGEFERLTAALNAKAFPSAVEAELFARTYLEPQLARALDAPTEVSWLSNDDAFQSVRVRLAVEWLEKYSAMPWHARETLFEICASHLGRVELASLTKQSCESLLCLSVSTDDEAKMREFWFLRALFFLEEPFDELWEFFRSAPESIFAVERRAGSLWRSDNPAWPDLSAQKIFRLVDIYIESWPRVALPRGYGTGDPPEETAYRFLTDIVWRIDHDEPRNSIPVLDRLLGDPRFTEFRDSLRSQRVSAMRKEALRDFVPPSPADIVGLLDDNRLATVEALRALLVEELEVVEQRVRNSETNPLRTFYDGARHVDENTSRDRIVDQLQARMTALNLGVNIERYMAENKRCDITVSAIIGGKQRLLVIEVKGQWNTELYTAANEQLYKRYSLHPDAAEQGIYLVLWFGPDILVAGKKKHSIETPSMLGDSILAQMPEELHTRIDVVVIDLSLKGNEQSRH